MKAALLVCALLAAQTAPRPAFDAASVRAAAIDGPRNSRSYGPQRVTFGGVSLAYIIGEAYNFPVGRIIGPSSLTRQALWPALATGFDVTAVTERPASKAQTRLMLQSLLADRFALTLHRESKVGPVYRLVRSQTALPLQESGDAEEFDMIGSVDGFVFRHAEMMRVTGHLSGQLDRPVVDDTGLTGAYNFTLKRPSDLASSPAKSEGLSPASPSAAAYEDALRALGLGLAKAIAPVDYLVIDSVGTLTEN